MNDKIYNYLCIVLLTALYNIQYNIHCCVDYIVHRTGHCMLHYIPLCTKPNLLAMLASSLKNSLFLPLVHTLLDTIL